MRQFKRKWTLDRQKFLSEAEVKKLRRAVEDKALADLQKGRTTWVRFWMAIDLAFVGLRVGEIARLKIGDLHLNSREPRLKIIGKGQRERDVYISRSLMKHLQDYLKWKKLLNEPTGEFDYLLISSHGKQYSTRTLQYAFKSSLRVAGLPEIYSIHACRHSFGTYLYKHTGNLRLVQRMLGHSAISTTQVYLDLLPEEVAEAVDGLFEEKCKEQSTPHPATK